jgi:sporulation protein YlmC with PRC-barrel domain
VIVPKFIIAKQLGGKKVISNHGEEIGRLMDATIDTDTGGLLAILVRPSGETRLYKVLEKTEDGLLVIPFKAVVAISDVVVVDETQLA